MTLKWSEMTPRERDALVWTQVMGGKMPTSPYLIARFPKYTTDISVAWEVVEKFDLYVVRRIDGGSYRCEINDASESILGSAFSATAPEAICLAALGASGVDV